MYARRPEGCLCALPFFVCTRQEISFSNGVKSRKKFHCALKAPVLGGATSPPLAQQKILLFLGRFTIQAGSFMSCFEVAEKNKLLKRPQASKMRQRKHGVSPAAQDPNVAFISTKLFESHWPRCASATHPVKGSSEFGVFPRSKVTQGGSDRYKP